MSVLLELKWPMIVIFTSLMTNKNISPEKSDNSITPPLPPLPYNFQVIHSMVTACYPEGFFLFRRVVIPN